MPKDLAQRLLETIDRELPLLRNLTEEKAAEAPAKPGAWTRKEELGHLIDSAANNHIRFVLATIDTEFRGSGYAQDKWVEAHGYRELPWSMLVEFWYGYNRLLAHVVDRIPEAHLNNRCVIGWGVVSLRFVIEDYVLHMQHHLDHVLSRVIVTPYPSAVAEA